MIPKDVVYRTTLSTIILSLISLLLSIFVYDESRETFFSCALGENQWKHLKRLYIEQFYSMMDDEMPAYSYKQEREYAYAKYSLAIMIRKAISP